MQHPQPQPNLTNLEKILIKDEDIKLRAYLDHLGNWTIGVGRLIGKDLKELKVSQWIAIAMLQEDIGTAVRSAVTIFGKDRYNNWANPRRDAILSLLFNMGEGNGKRGFTSFKKAIQAIKEEKWDVAAIELKDSNWAHQVDPRDRPDVGRDDRIAYMLRTGQYHEEYNISGSVTS